MKQNLTFMLLIFLCVSLSGQTKYLKDPNQTQELSKKVVTLFSENKISEVFEELSPFWPLPQNEINSVEEKTMKYLNLIGDRYGKSIGTIKVKNETIEDIALRETYLIRFDYTALRLIFTYYKNESGWIVNSFKWDDSFTEEFK